MIVDMRSSRGASAFTYSNRSRRVSGIDPNSFSGDGNPEHTWVSLIDELLRIRLLDDDWDGEGSEAPHPSLIDGAITLAQTLQSLGDSPADRVIASVNGTIYFEWNSPLGYQEIEVTSPLDAECRRIEKGTDRAIVFSLARRP